LVAGFFLVDRFFAERFLAAGFRLAADFLAPFFFGDRFLAADFFAAFRFFAISYGSLRDSTQVTKVVFPLGAYVRGKTTSSG
jgi:glutathione S-transferase